MFSNFDIRYSENFACLTCHVHAVVPVGTFANVESSKIADIVRFEFEAAGKLGALLKEISDKAKLRSKATYALHFGAIEHNHST